MRPNTNFFGHIEVHPNMNPLWEEMPRDREREREREREFESFMAAFPESPKKIKISPQKQLLSKKMSSDRFQAFSKQWEG